MGAIGETQLPQCVERVSSPPICIHWAARHRCVRAIENLTVFVRNGARDKFTDEGDIPFVSASRSMRPWPTTPRREARCHRSTQSVRGLQHRANGFRIFGQRCRKARGIEERVIGVGRPTIRRYVSTIGRAHRAAGVVDPTATEAVKLALKEMGRSVPARQKQARGLVWKEISTFLEFEPRGLRDIRDRALVTVAYDTMCRRKELVNLRVSTGSGMR
jgi:integrase